ncbi:hypothetical protein R3Q06_18940 [Rhodococcus erythropolis]|uniref:hypothetical protein n=1 Tax=Rhodococcus erythropolis TaxID=1833 RepID=UPI0029495A35|nr:hypothetical protein [Rhodococcus erythropolis]MDV6275577.1 hypothetical protein [Rhodococcus erythropolis]
MTGPYSTFRRCWPRVGRISIGDALGDFDAAIDGADNPEPSAQPCSHYPHENARSCSTDSSAK